MQYSTPAKKQRTTKPVYAEMESVSGLQGQPGGQPRVLMWQRLDTENRDFKSQRQTAGASKRNREH